MWLNNKQNWIDDIFFFFLLPLQERENQNLISKIASLQEEVQHANATVIVMHMPSRRLAAPDVAFFSEFTWKEASSWSHSPLLTLCRTSRPPWRWTSFRWESQGCVTLTLAFRCPPTTTPAPASLIYLALCYGILPRCHSILPSHAVAPLFSFPVALPWTFEAIPPTSFLKKNQAIHCYNPPWLS